MHSRALLATLNFLLVVGLYLPLGAPAAQEAIPGYPFLPLTTANVRAFSRQVEAEAKAMTAFLEQKYGDDRDKIERNPELTGLLHRRNELVEAFRLEEDGIKPIPCDPDFDFAVTTKQGRDFPVRRGQIQAGSRLVQELEATVHPEGLAEVISRKHD